MSSPTMTRSPEGNKREPCPLYGCKRVYTDTVALESHIKDHEIPAESIPGKVLLCSSIGCSDSFPDMQQLMQHMRRHHKPNIFFLCESCRAKLRSYRGLLMHLHTCSKVSRAKLKTEQMHVHAAPEGPSGYPPAAGEDRSYQQATPQGDAAAGQMQVASHGQHVDDPLASAPPPDRRFDPLMDSQEPFSFQQLPTQDFCRSSFTSKDGDMLTADTLQFDGQSQAPPQCQSQAQHQGQSQAQLQGQSQAPPQCQSQAPPQCQSQAQHQGQSKAQHQSQSQAQLQGQSKAQHQSHSQAQHQGQSQAPPQCQSQAQHQGQSQAPPQYQGQFQAQLQSQSQAQLQSQSQAQHQGQFQAPPQHHPAPHAPTSSAAVWKKNQGPPGNSRILWEHSRGCYRCVQCGLLLHNRKAMTAHIQTEHRTPKEG